MFKRIEKKREQIKKKKKKKKKKKIDKICEFSEIYLIRNKKMK